MRVLEKSAGPVEGRTADLQTEVWATAMRRQKFSYSEEKVRLLAKSARPPLSGPPAPGPQVLVPEGLNPKPLRRISERSRRSATSVNALSVHVLVYDSERMHASTKGAHVPWRSVRSTKRSVLCKAVIVFQDAVNKTIVIWAQLHLSCT